MKPLILLEDIHKVYRAGAVEVPALRGVTLTIQGGEFVAIMGASGSGKSTLMNIIGCLDRPSSGSYRLNGREVTRLGRAELAEIRNRTIGFVFQSFNLLPRMSAIENVELPLVYAGVRTRERRRRAMEALARMGLEKRVHHSPSELSGGQQQRVAIARAMVSEPKLLLADEPTGNLDSKTSIEVMALFEKLVTDGITILLVTHETEIAAFAPRVIVIRDGLILSDELRKPRRREAVMP